MELIGVHTDGIINSLLKKVAVWVGVPLPAAIPGFANAPACTITYDAQVTDPPLLAIPNFKIGVTHKMGSFLRLHNG